MSGYVKPFKVKDGDIDQNNEFMSFCIKDEKLFAEYKDICTKIEHVKNIKLNALKVYYEIYKNQNRNMRR